MAEKEIGNGLPTRIESDSTIYQQAVKSAKRVSSSSEEPENTSGETIELNLSETMFQPNQNDFIDDMLSEYRCRSVEKVRAWEDSPHPHCSREQPGLQA